MKKLTVTSMALALTLSFGATSAMADTLEDRDMAFAFESEGTMEVATLSEQEMRETEGAAFDPWSTATWTGGGAVFGGAAYAYKTWTTGSNWQWGGFGRAVGAGATTGFYSSPLMRVVLNPVTRYGASGLGAASWYTW